MRKVYYDLLLEKLRDKTGDSDEAGVSSVNGLSGDIQLLGPEGEALPVSGQNITGIATKEYVDSKPGVPGPEGPQGEPGPAGPEGPQGPQGNFEDGVISRPAAEFTVEDPVYGECVWLGAVTPVMTLAEKVCGINHVQFNIVTADPAVTGTIVLIPVVNGEERPSVLLPVGAETGVVHFFCSVTGKLAFRRDYASKLDTLKDGAETVTAILTHWELQRKNRLHEAAKDPSCILALFPYNGGMLLNPVLQENGLKTKDPGQFPSNRRKYWTDMTDIWSKIGTDDFRFRFKVKRTADFVPGTFDAHIFRGIGYIDIWTRTVNGEPENRFAILLNSDGNSNLIASPPIDKAGEYEFVLIREAEGWKTTLWMNGEVIAVYNGWRAPCELQAGRTPFSTSDDISILEFDFVNLNTGELIYHYPDNPAEKAGFLKNYNVTTKNDCFEPLSNVQESAPPPFLETGLDLQGTTHDFTLVTKTYFTDEPVYRDAYIFQQGYWYNGQPIAGIIGFFHVDADSCNMRSLTSFDDNGTRGSVDVIKYFTYTEFKEKYFNRPIVLAATLDRASRQGKLFIDGELVATGSFPAAISSSAPILTRGMYTGRLYPLGLFYGESPFRKYDYAFVYDRALSDQEIAAFI